MEDPTTIALNLTFFGTLGVAFVMFFGLFLVFVATLVIAGLGRLAAVTVMAVGRGLFGRRKPTTAGTVQHGPPGPATNRPARPAAEGCETGESCEAGQTREARKPAKKEPALSPDWAAAVAQADARAAARAKAEAAPAVKVSVRELPSPTAPARDVEAVAPLVESATDRNGQLGTVPPAFKKAPMPAAKSLLDTGSLVSLPGRLPLPRKPQRPRPRTTSGPRRRPRSAKPAEALPPAGNSATVKPMEFRYLGNSGFKISEITFGNWLTHGSQVENDVATQCVRAALDAGISTFDTADVYANTAAETVLGKALKDERRESLEIFTKVFGPTGPKGHNDLGLSRKHIMESINGSLTRLQTDYVDLYQAHRYDYETPLEETMQAFADIVRQGKALYIGVSEWTAGQIRDGHALAKELGFQLISNQPQYSMLWRVIEAEVIPTSEELGLSQIVWSPIAQGVLSGKYHPGKPAPEGSRATDAKGGSQNDRALDVRRGPHRRAAAQADRRGGRADHGPAEYRLGAAEPERGLRHHGRLPAGTDREERGGRRREAGRRDHGEDRRRDRLARRTGPGADQVARLPGGLGP